MSSPKREDVPLDPGTAPRPRTKQLEVMVADVIRGTPDAATLLLFTGNDHLDYQPGRFLTIRPRQFQALERFTEYFEEVKGRAGPARAYSISSAPHEGHLTRQHPERLRVVHSLSRDKDAARFGMETVLEALDTIGVPRKAIRRESYG